MQLCAGAPTGGTLAWRRRGARGGERACVHACMHAHLRTAPVSAHARHSCAVPCACVTACTHAHAHPRLRMGCKRAMTPHCCVHAPLPCACRRKLGRARDNQASCIVDGSVSTQHEGRPHGGSSSGTRAKREQQQHRRRWCSAAQQQPTPTPTPTPAAAAAGGSAGGHDLGHPTPC
jgi:hypothetical protein